MLKSKMGLIVIGCVGTIVVGVLAYNYLIRKKCMCLDCLNQKMENAQN